MVNMLRKRKTKKQKPRDNIVSHGRSPYTAMCLAGYQSIGKD